ncbi:ribosome maturation factor RimM [Emcibacter sp. SYSU 3D8]|uniref:ribosome maturation factor RimM n=1 Tax=Emcibacter sp. SYSU 3D8 TaxID=3133969 RepID=UPI0031FE5EC0
MAGQAEGLVVLGAIAGAHGVRGEVKVKTFTEAPETIAAYGPLTGDPGGRVFRVKGLRAVKDGAVVRLDGVEDREAAEALKGTRLCVSRAALGEPEEEDSFFHVDLIGLTAEDEAGTKLGTVIAVHAFGAGDMLDVRLDETGKSVLVPFRREMVPVVDLKGGRIVVRLDDEDEEAEGDSA